MAKRKYFTELGLNMQAIQISLLQQENLGDPRYFGSANPFHIYMIARRPRIAFKPGSLVFTPDTVSGVFTIQKGAALIEHSFSVPNKLGTDQISVVCPWPHTEFKFNDSSGKTILHGKVALLISIIGPDFWELLDLEVLYVGQSFGLSGERTAEDRLTSHSTLQKIYADAQARAPDQEIWIILMAFQDLFLISMDGADPDTGTTDDEDNAHWKEVLSSPVSEDQKINFTEAALIRYFQPEYNTVFRNSFPNPAHKTYADCYSLDINSVAFELHTEDSIHCKLWSSSAEAQWFHLATYALHNAEERRGMFEIGSAPGT